MGRSNQYLSDRGSTPDTVRITRSSRSTSFQILKGVAGQDHRHQGKGRSLK